MFKRLGIFAVVSMFVFLFAGLADAGVVQIVQPNTAESIQGGTVKNIKIDIAWGAIPSNAPIAKYSLFYTKNDGLTWNLITTRYCSLSFACSEAAPCCPEKYPWEVPFVESSQCKVKVKLFDAKGALIGKDASDTSFSITRYGGAGIPTCGNGIVEDGEQCDNGASNGTPGNCCSSQCTNIVPCP